MLEKTFPCLRNLSAGEYHCSGSDKDNQTTTQELFVSGIKYCNISQLFVLFPRVFFSGRPTWCWKSFLFSGIYKEPNERQTFVPSLMKCCMFTHRMTDWMVKPFGEKLYIFYGVFVHQVRCPPTTRSITLAATTRRRLIGKRFLANFLFATVRVQG